MKKFLVVLVLLLVVSGTALAAGQWHYCYLCGREHSGVTCPEACQNDCSLNLAGRMHKWYDCPEHSKSACWYCGDTSGKHNENTCPNGEVVWNDLKGTFRSAKYSYEEGTRLPQYCQYCEHYGYHSSNECLSVKPVKTPKPTSQPTSKPTEKPSYTATPKSTEKPRPTDVPKVCEHKRYCVEDTFMYDQPGNADYCKISNYWTRLICSDCGICFSAYPRSNEVAHVFSGMTCTLCGYTKECAHTNVKRTLVGEKKFEDGGDKCYVKYMEETWCYACGKILERIPYVDEQDHIFVNGVCRNCGKTEQIACPHSEVTYYQVGNSWYGYEDGKCIRHYNYKAFCDKCFVVVDQGTMSEEVRHITQNGVCQNCGVTIQPLPTTEVQPDIPIATVAPYVVHEAHEVSETNVWMIVAIALIIIMVIMFVHRLFRSNKRTR